MSGRGFARRRHRGRAEGYILLTLVLFMAMLAFAAAVIVPSVKFEITRDREEELIHRGVQYSRAIRRYTKTTGRYPVRLEDLQGTPQVRFLRKLYKDPITGKDFRLVRMREVMFGSSAPANVNAHQSATDPANGTSDATNPDGTPANGQDSGANSNGAAAGQNGASPTSNAPTPGGPSNGFGSGFGNTSGLNGAGNGGINGPNGGGLNGGGLNASSDNLPATEAFVGVASTSKLKSIREFDHKNHYKDWLFFYNSTYDKGLEIKGPTSLSAQTSGVLGGQGLGGIPGIGGQGQTGIGSQPGINSQPQSPIQQSPPNQ